MSVTDLEARIDDWVTSNGDWENDDLAYPLTERNTADDGSGEPYHRIDVRFLPDNSKANLLQKFEDKLQNKVDWYRIGYHACTHRPDDGSSGPCGWDDDPEWTAKDVTIPADIPEFTIDQ